MDDTAAKGRRVGGMLVAMLGAGLLLESDAFWSGMAVMLVGAALFAWGLAELRGGGPEEAPEGGRQVFNPPPARPADSSDPWTLDPESNEGVEPPWIRAPWRDAGRDAGPGGGATA